MYIQWSLFSKTTPHVQPVKIGLKLKVVLQWRDIYTVKPVFKTTWEIGTTLKLRTATSVPRSIYQIEMDLRKRTTSEFRTVLDSPLDVLNSKVPASLYWNYNSGSVTVPPVLKWKNLFKWRGLKLCKKQGPLYNKSSQNLDRLWDRTLASRTSSGRSIHCAMRGRWDQLWGCHKLVLIVRWSYFWDYKS